VQIDDKLSRVTVVGAGIMGSGIAQLAAMAGFDVTLTDAIPEQLQRARGHISASIDKLTAKGRLTPEDGERALGRVRLAGSLAEAADEAELVIEAVVEILEVKQSILAEAMAVAGPNALFATNTSQLSITAIASASATAADRVVGLHFFNPAVLMRLVEVVRGLQTSDATVEVALRFAQALGKETVVCQKDSPGFLTSRISAIVRLECLRMLE
jgi:3-hydroxybutyryl-CoA dehydrogenase